MPRPASTTARGYGSAHQAERERWAPAVRSGRVICWRCGWPIGPEAPWDLGHHDHDRSRYQGPEHPRCNRSAGARKRNGKRRQSKNGTSIQW